MGSFRPGAGNQHLHWYFNFTGCIVETVVFLLNSCLSLFAAAIPEDGTPYPEVTGPFCRVP